MYVLVDSAYVSISFSFNYTSNYPILASAASNYA